MTDYVADLDRYDVTSEGCWLWLGPLNKDGYAAVWAYGQIRGAHRVMFEREVELVPTGMQLDHLCNTKSCINPEHLEIVTASENMRRYWARKNKVMV